MERPASVDAIGTSLLDSRTVPVHRFAIGEIAEWHLEISKALAENEIGK